MLAIYTLLHVLISLVGIVAGFVVWWGFLTRKPLRGWTALFLVMTILTSVTGFGFPIEKLTPGLVLGVLSLIVLAVALYARYIRRMSGGWRRTFVISALIAQYFNVFVLVVQSFQKIPPLKALAPTQSEPPFAIAQVVVLVSFLLGGTLAVMRFRERPLA